MENAAGQAADQRFVSTNTRKIELAAVAEAVAEAVLLIVC